MDLNVLKWLVIGLVIVIAAGGVVVYLAGRAPEDIRGLSAGWRDLARRSRIVYTPPKNGALDTARLSGRHRQREVSGAIRIRMAYTGQGAHSTQTMLHYTRLEVSVENPQHAYLRINTKGGYRKTDQFLGQPLRPLGDPQIDRAFDIKCIPHDLSEALFARAGSLREGVLSLARNRYVELELKGSSVALEQSGIESDAQRLLDLFGLLCDLADAFDALA